MIVLSCPNCSRICYHTSLDFYGKSINGQNVAKCLSCGVKHDTMPTKSLKVTKDNNIVQFVTRSQKNNRGCP